MRPVSVTDAWQSIEASATMPEVSAEVVNRVLLRSDG
jgi:hypothetical protein